MNVEQVFGNDAKRNVELDFASVFKVNDACIFLRDHILRTTGQRIWGLTFTLYPDAQFKIEYDYTRPNWVTEEDDQMDIEAARTEAQASSSASQLAQQLQAHGVGAEASPSLRTALPDAQAALAWLQHQSEVLHQAWGFGPEASWNLDMGAGTLSFDFADGRTVVCPVQIIGTFNTDDGTLLWGWDHPSVPDALRRAAKLLQQFGNEHGVEALSTRKVACSEADAWLYTAWAAQADGAVGAYRGKAGSAWIYMCFGAAQ